ncbi:tetratricopeptide repeat protein [Bacteroidota bacterium]
MIAIKNYIFNVIIAVVLISSVISAQTNHKELFEKAKYTMETKGDLNEAIKLFDEIIKKYPDEREFSAKSQFYIGICYQKLGLNEAQKAFQNVISKYPEQTNIVTLAKERLAKLQNIEINLTKEDKDLNLTKVWDYKYEPYGGEPSPDGRYISFVNWESAEVAVCDLKTGKTRDITNDGTWKNPIRFPDKIIWSSDSKEVIYYWIVGEGENRTSEVRFVSLEDQEPRILAKGDFFSAPYPMDWSNDGKYVLAVQFEEDKTIPGSWSDQTTWYHKIVFMSVEDGTIRIVKDLGKNHFGNYASLSPDSRYIIYSTSQRSGPKEEDIFLISADGSYEVKLVEHPAKDWAPFFSPDGKQIIFLSDRTGKKGIYSLQVEDGKTHGKAELIFDNLPETVIPMGISDDGSFFFNISNSVNNIYTAEIDFTTGKVLSQPNKLPVKVEGKNNKPIWSPGGKYLGYWIQIEDFENWRNENVTFVKHNFNTGEEDELITELKVDIIGSPFIYPSWTPDGNSIITAGGPNFNPKNYGFFNLDLQTGETIELKIKEKDMFDPLGFYPQVSSDDKLFYLDGERKTIIKHDLKTGKEEELYQSKTNIYNCVLSPDGSQIAFSHQFENLNKLFVVHTISGEMREMGSIPEGQRNSQLCWAPDGSFVLVESHNTKELWKISVDGESQKIDFPMEKREHVEIHPDGKTIAFTQADGSPVEVWKMTNLLTGK